VFAALTALRRDGSERGKVKLQCQIDRNDGKDGTIAITVCAT
jgi:hypothetical protein